VTRSLEDAGTEIQAQLAAQKASQQVANRARELAGRIKTPADLDRIATESGLKAETSEFFTRDVQIPGLGVVPEAVETAFQLETGAVSGPIVTSRGPVFLTVVETREPYVPELDQVMSRVREDAIMARAGELSRQRALDIATALGSARNFAAAAKAQGVTVIDTQMLARGSAVPEIGVSPEVERAAFSLPVGGVSGPIATPDGTAIIRVVERDEVTPEELARNRETFRGELLNERRERFFRAYMTKARDRMQIQINDEVIQRVLSAL
jgi:peptidyl-prolyl cis-trans isomerase D